MRHLLLLMLLLACACKGKPKDVTLAGYDFTVPSSFSAEEERGSSYQTLTFDAFSFDGSCMVQLFAAPVQPQDWLDQMTTSFKGVKTRPASFTTGVGTLQGVTFQGALPSDTALGAIAQLAGTPSFELYAGQDGETTVGLMLMTVGAPSERAASRKACASILGSMRQGTTPADAVTP